MKNHINFEKASVREKTTLELENRLTSLSASRSCYPLLICSWAMTADCWACAVLNSHISRNCPCSARLTSAVGPCLAGYKDFPYAEFKQVNKKRFRGQTSEEVRFGIRQITKLCCSVDMMQTRGLQGLDYAWDSCVWSSWISSSFPCLHCP